MLERQRFLIKEHVAFVKLVDTYDIFDPDTREKLGVASEEPSTLVKWLRMVISKHLMPTLVRVQESEDESLLFTIRRPAGLWQTRVLVYDAEDELVGYFKTKLFSWTSGFWVYDKDDRQFAELRGDWKAWNFRFLTPEGREIGVVSKQWAGLAKEFFTSADNYVVALSDELGENPIAKMLLLAAALAIDVVLKEHK